MVNKRKRDVVCKPRIRILNGEIIALGPGKVDLLEAIQKSGSISAAARKQGLSYRRAWDMVEVSNQCFKQPLVSRAVGGKGGGGATLTSFGEEVVSMYRRMEEKAQACIADEWKRLKRSLKKTSHPK